MSNLDDLVHCRELLKQIIFENCSAADYEANYMVTQLCDTLLHGALSVCITMIDAGKFYVPESDS